MAAADRTVDLKTVTPADGRCPRCGRYVDEVWVGACRCSSCQWWSVWCLSCIRQEERDCMNAAVPVMRLLR